MDRWLSAVEQDQSALPLAQKIVADKPADLSDACWDGVGQKLGNQLCGALVVPVFGTPRTVAGDAISTAPNKCQLKPLRRAELGRAACRARVCQYVWFSVGHDKI